MDEMDREKDLQPGQHGDLGGAAPGGGGEAGADAAPAGELQASVSPAGHSLADSADPEGEAQAAPADSSGAAEAQSAPADSPGAVAPHGPAAAAAEAAPAPSRRRSSRALAAAALVALGAVLGAAGGTFATWKVLQGRLSLPAPASTLLPSSLLRPVVLAGQEVDLPALYERVAPGVVRIDSDDGNGTGFVVDALRGHILTNYHVVKGQKTVEVLVDDRIRLQGRVLGTDPSTDLALVAVDPKAAPLVALPLGDSDRVRPGDLAIAIGYPLGTGKSITAGIISGVGRTGQAPTGRGLLNLIQTDAAINPGNSGGPLLNAAGEVIGINTQILSPVRGFTGIGFAVPINTAKQVLPELAEGRDVQRPWLGISGEAVSAVVHQFPEVAQEIQAKEGVLVWDVYPNSPAEKAGLRPTTQTRYGRVVPGDVILAVDGRPVRTIQDILAYLDTKKPGDTVTLQVDRGGRQLELKLTLEPWPVNPDR
ncbi:MAG: trypsin-like peptidase domain-containing protein [Firmicutes bacterium]|nr:trypsin-like peptidase domain-containing protein [Bacillota bacterium]